MGTPTVSPRIRLRVSAPAPPGGSTLPDAPSWVTAIGVNRWGLVNTTNTVASLDPAPGGGAAWSGVEGQKAVINNWNGAALAHNIGTRGAYYLFGGGHNGYHGNEVYELDLADLTWRRRSDPYPTPNDGTRAVTGWLPTHTGQPNGSPGVPHTYRSLHYHDVLKCLVLLRMQATNEGGTSSARSKLGLFPLPGSAFTQYQWQEGSAYGGSGNPHAQDGWGCRDENRKTLLVHGGSGASSSVLASVDATTGGAQGSYGTWTGRGLKSSSSGSGSAHDPVNDFVAIFRTDGVLLGLDAADLTQPAQTLVTSAPPVVGKGMGFEYSYAKGGFIIWENGATVTLLKKNSGAGGWRGDGWLFTTLTNAQTGDPAPTKASTYTYSRFRIMRYANAEVAIVINGVTQPLYAFRLA